MPELDLKRILKVCMLSTLIVMFASLGSGCVGRLQEQEPTLTHYVNLTPTPVPDVITPKPTPVPTPTPIPTPTPTQTPIPVSPTSFVFPLNSTPPNSIERQVEDIAVVARDVPEYFASKNSTFFCLHHSQELVWRLRNRGYNAHVCIGKYNLSDDIQIGQFNFSRGWLNHAWIAVEFETPYVIYIEATAGVLISPETYTRNYCFERYLEEHDYTWNSNPSSWDFRWR